MQDGAIIDHFFLIKNFDSESKEKSQPENTQSSLRYSMKGYYEEVWRLNDIKEDIDMNPFPIIEILP